MAVADSPRSGFAADFYTEREAQALLKGVVHRLYIGNLKGGEHELVEDHPGRHLSPSERRETVGRSGGNSLW